MKYLLLVVKILLRSLHVYMLLTMGYAHTVMLHGIRESTPQIPVPSPVCKNKTAPCRRG